MSQQELESVAQAMVAKGKGILAADESMGTIKNRFDSIKIESNENNRRAYREMLFTTKGLEEAVSGVILFDETLRTAASDGTQFSQVLSKKGIMPGIKVDKGPVAIPSFPGESVTEGLDGLRARVVIDQLDFADFPQSGYRLEGQAFVGGRSGDFSGNFQRLEAQGSWVKSLGVHTLNLYTRIAVADLGNSTGPGRYTLGGFHQLSGYQSGQLEGNDLFLLRLGWYMRLSQTPTLTRGFFIGGTLEAGNVWANRQAARLADLRSGASVYLGADTGIGPLYLGLTYAPRGSLGLALFIGRP